MTEEKDNKLAHHIAVAVGLIGLGLWLYIGRYSGFLDWIILQVPEKYAGSALMIGIMVIMVPGLFIWTLYNRWIEKRLSVKGIYYEDEYYKDQDKLKEKSKAKKQTQESSDER